MWKRRENMCHYALPYCHLLSRSVLSTYFYQMIISISIDFLVDCSGKSFDFACPTLSHMCCYCCCPTATCPLARQPWRPTWVFSVRGGSLSHHLPPAVAPAVAPATTRFTIYYRPLLARRHDNWTNFETVASCDAMGMNAIAPKRPAIASTSRSTTWQSTCQRRRSVVLSSCRPH